MISHKLPSVNYTASGELFTWTNDVEQMVREFEADTDEQCFPNEAEGQMLIAYVW